MAVPELQNPLPAEVSRFLRANETVSDVQNDAFDSERFIIQSPYADREHLLDLQTLDNETSLLSRALSRLRAVREDYATASYKESFNWPEVFNELRRLVAESGNHFKETSFYIVAFRSQIKPSTDYSHLGELDKAAHAEAIASGGFLK